MGPAPSPPRRLFPAALLWLLALLVAALLVPAPRPPAPPPEAPPPQADPDVVPRRGGPACYEELEGLEKEMAGRLEEGRPFSDDAGLFDRLYRLARASGETHPYRLWLALFSPRLQARIRTQTLVPTPWDRKAVRYLTQVLDPAWSLRIASVARSGDPEVEKAHLGPQHCPPALRQAMRSAALVWDQPEDRVAPWTGVNHLFFGSYTESRGPRFAETSIQMARTWIGGLRGRAMAEVGAGSGPCLEAFREALGPGGKLYAVEVDPFALHLLRDLNGGVGAWAILGTPRNSELPRRSLDMITMIGVHLGPGLTDLYKDFTLPWLRSMARALRPGGILVLDDGDAELLRLGAVPKVEAAGFTKLVLLRGADHPRDPHEWVAVFRVDPEVPEHP